MYKNVINEKNNKMPGEIITFVTGNHNKVKEFVEILGPGISFNVRNVHIVIIVIMNSFVNKFVNIRFIFSL